MTRPARRSSYDAPTARLLLTFDHHSSIDTLEGWEAFAKFIQREVTRERMRQYAAKHPWQWVAEPEF